MANTPNGRSWVEIDYFPRFKGDPSAWMIFCMFLCPPFSRIFRCSQSNCAPASAMAVRSSFLFFSGGATLDISFVTYTKTSSTIHQASSNPTCTPLLAAAAAKPGIFLPYSSSVMSPLEELWSVRAASSFFCSSTRLLASSSGSGTGNAWCTAATVLPIQL